MIAGRPSCADPLLEQSLGRRASRASRARCTRSSPSCRTWPARNPRRFPAWGGRYWATARGLRRF
eukprot:3155330-Alexandrium_andersonii.AAC.1